MDKTRNVDFRAFWDAYGRKRDRMAAERAWNRLSARDRRAAFDGIARYREACRRDGVAMMYGQGYLTHRRWEDEDDEAQEPSAAPSAGALEDMEIW